MIQVNRIKIVGKIILWFENKTIGQLYELPSTCKIGLCTNIESTFNTTLTVAILTPMQSTFNSNICILIDIILIQ